MPDRQAGTYARERYQAGLRSYRRRMRPYFLGLLTAAFVALAIVAALHGIDRWSLTAGVMTGGLISMALWLRDEPPEFIAKWGRGAQGEKKTAKAIAPLLREGWKARHDIDLGRGNADHLLLNPAGVAFLLETKKLVGQITVERGRLTCRFADDPNEPRRYDLKSPIAALTSQVREQWSRRSGREAPELRTVVVLWGIFPARIVRDGELVYVAGDALADYLRQA